MLNELARLNELRPSDRKALQRPASGVVIATPAPPPREVFRKLPVGAAALLDHTRFEPSPAAVVSIRVELLRSEPPPQVVEAVAERSSNVSNEPPPQPTAAGSFEAQMQGRAAAAYGFQRSLAEPSALTIGPYRRLDVRA